MQSLDQAIHQLLNSGKLFLRDLDSLFCWMGRNDRPSQLENLYAIACAFTIKNKRSHNQKGQISR
jgi:hypothetical protein